jgi:hypothetical protein
MGKNFDFLALFGPDFGLLGSEGSDNPADQAHGIKTEQTSASGEHQAQTTNGDLPPLRTKLGTPTLFLYKRTRTATTGVNLLQRLTEDGQRQKSDEGARSSNAAPDEQVRPRHQRRQGPLPEVRGTPERLVWEGPTSSRPKRSSRQVIIECLFR